MDGAGIATTNSALIILSRLPREGQVKTRLADSVGDRVATEFYRLCAERLFREAQRVPHALRRYVFYSGAESPDPFSEWAGNNFHFERQRGADFGERMHHAFDKVFNQRMHKAIVVGTDIPDLSADLMYEAFHLLDIYDLVIGPDHGGGYYLLGMKRLHSELFRNIPWGTSRVYGQTLRMVKALDLSIAFLPVLMDVDTGDDLQRWLESRRERRAGSLEEYLKTVLSSQ